jgi:hypothetical protein
MTLLKIIPYSLKNSQVQKEKLMKTDREDNAHVVKVVKWRGAL